MGGWVPREESSDHNPWAEPIDQICDGPLHWETAVADFLETLETWHPVDNFNNA